MKFGLLCLVATLANILYVAKAFNINIHSRNRIPSFGHHSTLVRQSTFRQHLQRLSFQKRFQAHSSNVSFRDNICFPISIYGTSRFLALAKSPTS